VPRLIHLNGPKAGGKTTLAHRYSAEHPGTLLCDIDRLRTLIGGWESDPEAAARIRTAALALITAYLSTGYDVVLPQLVMRRDQIDRFRAAAEEAGAEYVGILLEIEPYAAAKRLHSRGRDAGHDAWARFVLAEVAAQGGDAAFEREHAAFEAMAAGDDALIRIKSTDLDSTYDALLKALGER